MYMPTLPSTFDSLVGKTVKIKTEEPQYLIELLGDVLGVTDYKTNKAAFWFLNTIALQLLHYKNCLDDHHISVLISWLAGEMKLIRDKKLSREDFFKEMRIYFLFVAETISSGDQLLHWELIMDKCPKNVSINSTSSVSNKSSNEKLGSEYSMVDKIKRSLIMEKSRDSENSLQWKSPEDFQTSLSIENSQIDTSIDANVAIESSNLTHLNIALDAIIEATYNMYANELRYALIHAVFVTPIQLQIYHMPHTLRVPRLVKVADPKGPFNKQLYKELEKASLEEKKMNTNAKKDQKVREDLNNEGLMTPPSSLTEEETLVTNRRFILPLIEAKEAAQIYEMHAKNMK
ncbi:uncharacterized protein LOC126850588 [Cataglyphis hispanica]|uniref:uncharacterized protein LOC126850588 n=1 Tax=Cataglyphis hispanica TaxID=1086592 RepID=UPI002180292F|nr:uncharacterized protein LOC126850588 [Cataglyphis hispanica]